jgi:hypothetical protein
MESVNIWKGRETHSNFIRVGENFFNRWIVRSFVKHTACPTALHTGPSMAGCPYAVCIIF